MAQYVGLILGALGRPLRELPKLACFVVYLSPSDYREDPGALEYRSSFGVQLEVAYKVVRLWELDPEPVLAGEHPGLYPFVPLMRGNPEELVVRSKERIDALPESLVSVEGKRELLAVLAGLAGRVLRDPNRLRELLGEISKMGENLVFDILREEGEAKGRKQGQEEGRVQEARRSILRVLTVRFGTLDATLSSRIQALESIDQLESLLETALACASLNDFGSQLT